MEDRLDHVDLVFLADQRVLDRPEGLEVQAVPGTPNILRRLLHQGGQAVRPDLEGLVDLVDNCIDRP